MRFYSVEPAPHSFSRRWCVDDAGLEVVRQRYTQYPKDGGHIDRWHEFTVEEAPKVRIDFGGMMRMDEPVSSFSLYGTAFSIMVSHLPYLCEALETPRDDDLLWNIGTRFWVYVFSRETVQQMLPLVKALETETVEQRRLAEEQMQQMLAEVNKDGLKVIRQPRSLNTPAKN